MFSLINMDYTNSLLMLWFIPLLIWEVFWKGISLWKASRNNQIVWFVCLLIFNTLGILPIIYLLIDKYSKNNKIGKKTQKKSKSKKRK